MPKRNQRKADEARIERAYLANCHGVRVSVMDIGRVFTVGHGAIAAGMDDEALGATIAAFVETIRADR